MPSKPSLCYSLPVIAFLTLQLVITDSRTFVIPSSSQHSNTSDLNSSRINSSYSSLNVEFPTLSFLKRPPKFYLAHTQATAIFECIPDIVNETADGVIVSWVLPHAVPIISKNDIHSDEHAGAYITPNNSILILHNLEEIFSGTYKCIVQRVNGTRIVAEMTLKVILYMDEMRRWLVICLCGGGTCFVIILISILSCKIESKRKRFYKERQRVKMQRILYSHH